MEKTIQNIKKILHIGPKKSKGDLSENGSSEKQKVQQRDYETVAFTG